ncbi:hypothetical protein [Kitasatospora sp. NPDC057015]|uniref:hypothetical protein n=1 Tax=Kitasatospora sp. NPDC057015 TaxID=3346001 RepID=UPI003628943D
MSGKSFQIDLDEVEAAAKVIRSTLADLEAPAARLEAVIKQIQPAAYGRDAVGKALTGGTSAVGGVPDHQKQIFEGVRRYLVTSAQLAANLELMCSRYRETDTAHADQVRQLDGGRGASDQPAVVPAATVEPPPIVPPKEPVALLPPTATPAAIYQDPNAPTLEYNDRTDADTEREPRTGAGGSHQLI